jgi:predicted ribosomally synthesized peptide with SipW-like signal peptide
LIASVCAVIMCAAMLIGSTFAWFTDTASTSVNSIKSGTLGVNLLQATAWDGTTGAPTSWDTAEGKVLTFRTKDNRAAENILWEPGAEYKLPELKVENNGTLALKYKLEITGIKGNTELNDVIDWTITVGGETYSIDKEFTLKGKSGETMDSDIITISGKMQTTAGNDYQNKSIEGITISVKATQMTSEFDSTTDQYDAGAEYPVVAVAPVTTKTGDNDTTLVASTVDIKASSNISVPTGNGNETTVVPAATVTVPADAQLASGATQLKLTIDEDTTPANFTVKTGVDESKQEVKTLEINLEGLNKNNSKPVIVTFYVGADLTGFKLYHTEDSGVITMTSVTSEAEVDTANEYYYNSTTGKVTMAVTSFSPFTYAYNSAKVSTSAELTEALKAGGIVDIMGDVAMSESIKLSNVGTINLNLNNKSITSENIIGNSLYGCVCVFEGTKLIISGGENGKFVNTDLPSIVRLAGGEIVINSGNFESAEACIFTYPDGAEWGTLTINGGTFKAGYVDYHGYSSQTATPVDHLVINDSNTWLKYIVINGGDFYNWNPSAYVDDNHIVTNKTVGSDTIYTVSAK